jgi:2-polyprenyl-3-methyl-5-hydroxy-6-metoxy-1,4-benzoquinol methylase
MAHQSSDRYTQEQFWADYWASIKLPSRVNHAFSFDRTLAAALKKHVPVSPGQRLIEIGCAPGRWMIFAHDEMKLAVDGVEYVGAAAEKTRENLQLSNVSGTVHHKDFFDLDLPAESYDVVLSIGFIEHFADTQDVIARQLKLLRPGGVLVMTVPNFQKINWLIQALINREWLKAHKTELASLRFFNEIPAQFSIEKLWTGYIGGFEPMLLEPLPLPAPPRTAAERWRNRFRYAPRLLARLTLTVLGLMRRPLLFLDHINCAWFSGCVMGVYRKPLNPTDRPSQA